MQALRAQFEQQRQAIIANLDTAQISKSYTRKDWLQDLLDWAEADENMRKALQPILYVNLIATGREAFEDLGREPSIYDPFTPAITGFFQDRAVRIARDVNEETEKQVRASLSQGVADGETTYQLRARVEQIMGASSTIRADRISRTETTRLQSFADVEAWQQSGLIESKEWYTAQDERVCPWCRTVDGQVRSLTDNFFEKDDTFEADGKVLRLKYDDVPGAPLHVQCRCVLLPVRKS